jgi:hypothetical protein
MNEKELFLSSINAARAKHDENMRLKEQRKKDVAAFESFLGKLETQINEIVEEHPTHAQQIAEEVITEMGRQPEPELPVKDIINKSVEFLAKTSQQNIQQAADDLPNGVRKELDIIKKSITDLHRFASRHSQMGGGGEVKLRFLDDVDRNSISDGHYLKYDAGSNKFVFSSISDSSIDWLHVPSNIIPSTNGVYSLGNNTVRWESLWVGSNSVIFSDQNTSYPDQRLTVSNGVFFISTTANTSQQSNAGFRVGNFLLQNNFIGLTDSNAVFYIGSTAATGNLVINRPIVVYSTGTNSNPTFAVDRNGQVQIHTPNTILTTNSALSIVGSNSGVAQPRNYNGTLLQATAQDGQPARISIDAFGSNTYAAIAGRGARGTVVSPTQTQANDTIIRMSMQGWTADGNTYAGSIGRINMMAAEDFYTANTGTKITFQLTPTGSNTIQNETVAFYANGMSFVNNPNSNAGITFTDGSHQTTAYKAPNVRIDAAISNTVLIDFASDNIIHVHTNAGTLTANIQNLSSGAGRSIELFIFNNIGGTQQFNHSLRSGTQATGGQSFYLSTHNLMYVKYFCLDGTANNTFVTAIA